MQNKYIGLIMDGNRRWAKKYNKTYYEAYKNSIQNYKKIISEAISLGIKELSCYALSYDNYHKRSSLEINQLLEFCITEFNDDIDFFIKNKIVIKFIGNKNILPANTTKELQKIEDATRQNDYSLIGNILMAYDPHEDIAGDMQKKLKFSYDIQPINLIIRTGGRNRLSGFLPSQSMYANIVCIETLWPDFTPEIFAECIKKNFINNYGA